MIENNTQRRTLYGPLRAKMSIDNRKAFGKDRNSRNQDSTQNAYPFKTFEAHQLQESHPETFGPDQLVTWPLSDLIRSRYLLRFRKKLLNNVIHAQVDGRWSSAVLAKFSEELLNETDKDALKKCMVTIVYQKRMSEMVSLYNDTNRLYDLICTDL